MFWYNVCNNCLTKERAEFSKFKNYVEENNINNINTIDSLNNISFETGISNKTLNRFLTYDNLFNGFDNN